MEQNFSSLNTASAIAEEDTLIPLSAPTLRVERTVSRSFLFALFTLSGFSGLIYESIWTHYLKLFLGHAAYAQTLVLMLFMGGMAGGSWRAARSSHRWRNLLMMYAVVEGLIGILALTFHTLFTTTTAFAYTHLLPTFDSPLTASLV